MGFGSISVDANTELILLIGFCATIGITVVFFFILLISRQRLGRLVVGSGIITFLLLSVGLYDLVITYPREEMIQEQEIKTLETNDGKVILQMDGRIPYKPQGTGPIIAVADFFSKTVEGGENFTIDGTVIDATGISDWLGTTSPENTPAQEMERGREYERQNGRRDSANIMIYIMAFIILMIGGLIAYEVVK